MPEYFYRYSQIEKPDQISPASDRIVVPYRLAMIDSHFPYPKEPVESTDYYWQSYPEIRCPYLSASNSAFQKSWISNQHIVRKYLYVGNRIVYSYDCSASDIDYPQHYSTNHTGLSSVPTVQ